MAAMDAANAASTTPLTTTQDSLNYRLQVRTDK
jgi:hypothetical protein